MENLNFNSIQRELLKPIPYKFRLQSAKYGKATIVSYIDSRDLQDRLDEVVGAANWQVRYEEIKGNLFASIGINTGNEWVWKSDCGTESSVEKAKGEASDSFKRAGVMWGVGRFLYSLPPITLQTTKHTNKAGVEKEYPVDNTGRILWNGDDLSAYCALLVNSNQPEVKEPVKQPEVMKPELMPNSDNWKKAVKWMVDQDGLVFDSLDKIKNKYSVTAENEEIISQEVKAAKGSIPQDTQDTIEAAGSSEELTKIFNELTGLHANPEFIKSIERRREEILLPSKRASKKATL